MQHLEEGTIHAWLDGALPPLEAEQVAAHAADCAACAAAVAEARGIIAGSARIVSALDDVPAGVIPRGERGTAAAVGTPVWRRLRLTPGRAALAATLLLAVSATLTLRSSESPPPMQKDRAVGVAASQPVQTPPPAPSRVTLDSVKLPGPPARVANASAQRKPAGATNAPHAQVLAERSRAVAAVATGDSGLRDLQKVRALAQEPTAGATAAAAPPAAASMKASNMVAARASAARDSASAFEGCYRLSADSSVGSTEMPRGLPARFTLSRPAAELRAVPPRFAGARADSSGSPIVWQQLSATQVNVTFGSANARQVSLTLTAGSPVGVASSGDRTTTVRVVRAPCPP
jgi:hypothetical protein